VLTSLDVIVNVNNVVGLAGYWRVGEMLPYLTRFYVASTGATHRAWRNGCCVGRCYGCTVRSFSTSGYVIVTELSLAVDLHVTMVHMTFPPRRRNRI
jgi:hypothetical protein